MDELTITIPWFRQNPHTGGEGSVGESSYSYKGKLWFSATESCSKYSTGYFRREKVIFSTMLYESALPSLRRPNTHSSKEDRFNWFVVSGDSVHGRPIPKQKNHSGRAWKSKVAQFIEARKQNTKDRARGEGLSGHTFKDHTSVTHQAYPGVCLTTS